MTRTPNISEFFDQSKRKGYEVFENASRPYNLNIVGWRNKEARVNEFDDYIALYYVLPNHKWNAHYFKATTLPGKPYLLDPLNRKGTAILVPGQYQGAYKLGLHKGYMALKQVKEVLVYRDSNKDEKLDLGKVEAGLFGIDIHRAGLLSSVVGMHSAGCQVIQSRDDYKQFIDLCSLSAQRWGNSFTYTLLEF